MAANEFDRNYSFNYGWSKAVGHNWRSIDCVTMFRDSWSRDALDGIRVGATLNGAWFRSAARLGTAVQDKGLGVSRIVYSGGSWGSKITQLRKQMSRQQPPRSCRRTTLPTKKNHGKQSLENSCRIDKSNSTVANLTTRWDNRLEEILMILTFKTKQFPWI